jgi:hypothetical protein
MVRGTLADPQSAPDPAFASAILVLNAVAVSDGRERLPQRDEAQRTGTDTVPLRILE